MTRKTHTKSEARALAARDGLSYQQALRLLQSGNVALNPVQALRLAYGEPVVWMTNGCLENILPYSPSPYDGLRSVPLDEFTALGFAVSYWNTRTGEATDAPTGEHGEDWYPLTIAESQYITDNELAGPFMLTYSGFTKTESGENVKALILSAELSYDDPEWRSEGYTFESRESVLAVAYALKDAMDVLVAPLGGYSIVMEDDYIAGPIHSVNVFVPLPTVMEHYPVAGDWFAAAKGACRPVTGSDGEYECGECGVDVRTLTFVSDGPDVDPQNILCPEHSGLNEMLTPDGLD